jgi:hypothetical protein
MDEAKRPTEQSQDLGQWPTSARRTFTASGWRKFQAKIRSQVPQENLEPKDQISEPLSTD